MDGDSDGDDVTLEVLTLEALAQHDRLLYSVQP